MTSASNLGRGVASSPGAAGPADLAAAPRGCTNFKLRQLTRRVSLHFDRILAGAGLRTTQYSLLMHIERLGPISPGDLSRAMAMEASTLTRNLRPLLEAGWAELGPGPDGRTRAVTVTPEGKAKRLAAGREWRRAQEQVNARLGAAKVAQLHRLLDECLVLMDPEPPGAADE